MSLDCPTLTRLQRSEGAEAPEPTFIETIPSASLRGFVRLHFYTPSGFGLGSAVTKTTHPVVTDFYGGGFSTGMPTMDAYWASALLAPSTPPVVVGVEYSLAREHPFPAAIQVAAAALPWLTHKGADKHGLDPERIVLSGFSADRTLTFTTWI